MLSASNDTLSFSSSSSFFYPLFLLSRARSAQLASLEARIAAMGWEQRARELMGEGELLIRHTTRLPPPFLPLAFRPHLALPPPPPHCQAPPAPCCATWRRSLPPPPASRSTPEWSGWSAPGLPRREGENAAASVGMHARMLAATLGRLGTQGHSPSLSPRLSSSFALQAQAWAKRVTTGLASARKLTRPRWRRSSRRARIPPIPAPRASALAGISSCLPS